MTVNVFFSSKIRGIISVKIHLVLLLFVLFTFIFIIFFNEYNVFIVFPGAVHYSLQSSCCIVLQKSMTTHYYVPQNYQNTTTVQLQCLNSKMITIDFHNKCYKKIIIIIMIIKQKFHLNLLIPDIYKQITNHLDKRWLILPINGMMSIIQK